MKEIAAFEFIDGAYGGDPHYLNAVVELHDGRWATISQQGDSSVFGSNTRVGFSPTMQLALCNTPHSAFSGDSEPETVRGGRQVFRSRGEAGTAFIKAAGSEETVTAVSGQGWSFVPAE